MPAPNGKWRLRIAPCLLAAECIWATGSLRAQQPVNSAIQWPTLSGSVQPTRRFHLDEPPMFQVGTAQGPDYTLFNGIIGMVRLQGGNFGVGDAGNFRVLLFDSLGRLTRSVERRDGGTDAPPRRGG